MCHLNIWDTMYTLSPKYLRAKALERNYPEFFKTSCLATIHEEGKYKVIIYRMIWLNHSPYKVLYIPCVLEGEKLHIKMTT